MSKKETRLVKYRLWSYDVWGNPRDGFEVNDRYPCAEIELPAQRMSSGHWHVPNVAVVKALKADGWIKKNIRYQSIEIGGEDEYTLYVNYGPTCRPEYELECQEPEKFEREEHSASDAV